MNGRELVKLALQHKETGRVPYRLDFTPGAAEKIKPYIQEGDFELAIGNHVYTLQCPWWDWHNVPVEYKGFDAPEVMPPVRGYGSYEAFRDKLQYIRDMTGCYILVIIYGSHFEKAYFARGMENLLADFACNREFVKSFLDTIIRKNMVMLENIITFPEIDGILLGSDWGSQCSMLMSPEIWRELIAPGELKEYELIKQAGKDVWIHSCGNIEAIIPDLVGMGVDVLNPVQPEVMDIYKLKKKFGHKVTFWGGISTQRTLPYGTPEEVKTEAEKVIKLMSMGGGYVSAPAQSIQDDVPVENLLALIESVKRFAT